MRAKRCYTRMDTLGWDGTRLFDGEAEGAGMLTTLGAANKA